MVHGRVRKLWDQVMGYYRGGQQMLRLTNISRDDRGETPCPLCTEVGIYRGGERMELI